MRSSFQKQELKIENIVTELGKYAQTAKNYKTHNVGLKLKTEPQPEVDVSEEDGSQTVRITPHPYRNRRDELKLLLKNDGEEVPYEQTLDTIRLSKMTRQV